MENKSKKEHEHSSHFFGDILLRKFINITGLPETVELKQALYNITGNSFVEMRRLTGRSLKMIEEFILAGRYTGYVKGNAIKDSDKTMEKLHNIPEDMKIELRAIIKHQWKEMEYNQRRGIEKLAQVIKDNYGK